MPGLQESLNRTTLQPRTDSSDSFANTQMSRDMHNDGEKEERTCCKKCRICRVLEMKRLRIKTETWSLL
jgi:hypothetical protein